MIQHHGVPLAYILEQLGEPMRRETIQSAQMRATVAFWHHSTEPPFGCTAQKMGPPDREDLPDDNWWIRPCPLHEAVFAEFPLVTVGTPAWREQA